MHPDRSSRRPALVAIACAALVALFAYFCFGVDAPDDPQLEAGAGGSPSRVTPVERDADGTSDRAVDRQDARDAASAPRTGSLVVQVLYEDEEAGADISVRVRPARGDRRVGSRVARTDARGHVRFDDLQGYFKVDLDRSLLARKGLVRVYPGQVSELKLVLAVAQEIRGVVVDPSGRRVEGAALYLASVALLGVDAAVATHSDADGRFRIRSGFNPSVVWAVAPGFEPSKTHSVGTAAGGSDDLRLVLPRIGGSFVGRVEDESGKAVENAIVRVGTGRLDAIRRMGAQPRVHQVRTDAHGDFVAHGISEGEHRIDARAEGYCLTTKRASVRPGQRAPVRLVLTPESVVRGVVRDAFGETVRDARFSWGEDGTLEHVRARTDRYGRYEMRGLSAGPTILLCAHREFGSAERKITTVAGQVHDIDFLLEAGRTLRADVLDMQGKAVEGVTLQLESEGLGKDGKLWRRSTRSDRDGLVTLHSLPPGRFVALLRAPAIENLTLRHVDPDAGELLFRVRRRPAPRATVRGTVVDPLLQPMPRARVMLLAEESDVIDYELRTDETGSFAFERVRAGRYWLRVAAEACAEHASALLQVERDASVELPDIQMRKGGRLLLTLELPEQGKPCRAHVFDLDGQWRTSMRCRTGVNELRDLAPGRYRLTIEGGSYAAQSAVVELRDGRATELRMRLEKGRKCRFVLDPGPETVQRGRVRVRLSRAGVLLLDEYEDRVIRAKELDFVLADGDYELRLGGGGEAAVRHVFRVAPGDGGAPVRIALP